MKDFKSVKKLALYSVATVMCVAGQNVFAHTGIKDKVTEGAAGYNALTITHGCNNNAKPDAPHKDVIAVSAVFPNSSDTAMSVVRKLDAKGDLIAIQEDLSNDIEGVNPGVGFTNMGLGLVAGGGTLFANIIPTLDGNGAIRGYHTWAGPLPYLSAPLQESIVSTTGLSSFKYGAIKFKPESCAKSLKVRIAVANWCKRGEDSKTHGNRVDVWIGHTTPLFADPRIMPYNEADTAAGKSYWPTMTVERNLVTNPLKPSCAGGFDLSIEPTDVDIDAYLPIPKGEYPKGAPGGKFQN
ncbi:MAG: hypothetical protein WC685_14710 [Methylobacter sp.]|jgi:hypothetical protein